MKSEQSCMVSQNSMWVTLLQNPPPRIKQCCIARSQEQKVHWDELRTDKKPYIDPNKLGAGTDNCVVGLIFHEQSFSRTLISSPPPAAATVLSNHCSNEFGGLPTSNKPKGILLDFCLSGNC